MEVVGQQPVLPALALSLTANRLNRIFKKELGSIYRRFT